MKRSASLQAEKPHGRSENGMKKIVRKTMAEAKAMPGRRRELAKLAAMPDGEIDEVGFAGTDGDVRRMRRPIRSIAL